MVFFSWIGYGDFVENWCVFFWWVRRFGDWSCRRSRNWCGDGRGLIFFWRIDGNWEFVCGMEWIIFFFWWVRVNGFDDNRCFCSFVKCGCIFFMVVVYNFVGIFSVVVFISFFV